MNEMQSTPPKSSFFNHPPACYEKKVRWLRDHKGFSLVFCIILAGALLQVAFLKQIPFETKAIILGISLAAIGIVAIPIIFEWKRQISVEKEEARALKAAHEKNWAEFLKSHEKEIEAHRNWVIEAIGGKEAFNKLPIIILENLESRASDLHIFAEEMEKHSMLRGILEKTLNGETTHYEFIAIRFRAKKENTLEPNTNSIHVITLYPRKLYDGTEQNPKWFCVGSSGYLFHRDLDPRFEDSKFRSAHYEITNDEMGNGWPSLQAISELVQGTHKFYELV